MGNEQDGRWFRALYNTIDLSSLAEAPTPDKEEHPFTYCKEVVIPAIEAKGKKVDDPDQFCGWWKQERAAEAAHEHPVGKVARHIHLIGATGQLRTGQYEGREHIVVPVVALMEGVIHAINAETPEFVPIQCLACAPQGWNGRPIVLAHPVRNGRQISANSPEVLEAQAFGRIFNARILGKKLLMDAWIDPVRAKAVGADRMLERIQANDMVEVSVGAFVVAEATAGIYNNKIYKAVWKDVVPDHLAFLPRGVGACSNQMGCGTPRAAEAAMLITADGWEAISEEQVITALGGPGSGNFGHSGRPGEIGGSGGEGGGGSKESKADRVKKLTAERTALRDELMAKGVKSHGDLHEKDLARIHDVNKRLKEAHESPDDEPVHQPQASKGFELSDKEKASNYEKMHGKAPAKATEKPGFDSKDSMRINDIRKKAGGNPDKELSLSHQMAKSIKDVHKAKRRAHAAEDQNMHDVAAIFHKRAHELKGASSIYDTPEQRKAEEDAEMIQYETLRTLCDQLGDSYESISNLIDQLIRTEKRDPDANEEAETKLEYAKFAAIQTLCMSMYSSINAIQSITSPPPPTYSDVVGRAMPACCEKHAAERAAAGARHSADDRAIIQGVHDHAVKLGAECSKEHELTAAIGNEESCPDCAAARALAPLPVDSQVAKDSTMTKVEKAAAKVSADYTIADAVKEFELSDDEASELRKLKAPAKDDDGKEKFDPAKVFKKRDASEGATMTKDQRGEVIKSLVANKHSGFVTGDEAILEAASDDRLESFRVAAAAREVEVKKTVEQPAETRSLLGNKKLTEEEFLSIAPDSFRTLIERQQTQDVAIKTNLVSTLKAAQTEYSESELSAMTTDNLERFARAIGVPMAPAPTNFSGRGMPRQLQADKTSDVYANPPNPYEAGIKALRAANGQGGNGTIQ